MRRRTRWHKLWSYPYLWGLGLGLLPLAYAVLPLPGPWMLAFALYIGVWLAGIVCSLAHASEIQSLAKGLLTAAALSPFLWIAWFIIWITWFASDYDRFRVFY